MTDNIGATPSSNETVSSTAKSMMLFEANKKSIGVAYLLWFFFGSLGGHRYYVGQTGSAIAMTVIFVLSWFLLVVYIGFVGLLVVGVWALVDAFLIPGWIRAHNTKLAQTL